MENPSICGGNECVNTYGTYTCIEPQTSTTEEATTTTTTTHPPSTTTAAPIESEEEEDDDTDNVDENNEIPEIDREPERSHESERESDKEEDIDNSVETGEIDNEVTESRSTPEPAIPTSPSREESPSTTEGNHEIVRPNESENESGEGSEGDDDYDERRSDVEEEKHSELHHQSSTVKSDVRTECDDGLRLDSDGKCVGEWN